MSPRLVRLIVAIVVLKVLGHVALALAAVRYKQTAPAHPEPDANEIDLVVVMDGARYASTAPAFRGGRVTCWYAGLDVDLREATLDPAGARLEVRTAFGGTRIVVAPGVPVRVHAPAVFGGTSNETHAAEPTADAPGLEIRGFTTLGGLQVIAAEPGAELAGWSGTTRPVVAPTATTRRRPASRSAPDVDARLTAPRDDGPPRPPRPHRAHRPGPVRVDAGRPPRRARSRPGRRARRSPARHPPRAPSSPRRWSAAVRPPRRCWRGASRRPPLHVDERVGEVRYGSWTGRELKALRKEPLWTVIQAHPSAAVFPDGEGLAAMSARAVAAVRDWNARLGPEATYALVSHADVIKAIVADALGLHLDGYQRIAVDPCSLSVVRYGPRGTLVERVNDGGGSVAGLVAPSRRPGRRGTIRREAR